MIGEDVLERLPTAAGVYVFADVAADVIYVGKAKNLRTRVRQYFRPGGDERFFVAAGFLREAAASVETIVVRDEKEALLLENHLIKKHQPRFNVKLRDDKQYLVLRVLPPPAEVGAGDNEAKRRLFPRVEVVRNIRDDDARYFGPYHSATSARETLRVLNRHFQLRTCSDHVLESRGRVCLQYQIKRCVGPCAIAIEPAAYRDQVEDVLMFLGGRDRELVTRLGARMHTRAAAEDFETAAHLRDSIAAVERTLSKQLMVQDEFIDQDVWGLFREGGVATLSVLFVRHGKLVGRRIFHQKRQELPDAEVLGEHIQQYYATGTIVPDEVVVGVDLLAGDALEEWLTGLRGGRRKVRLLEPRRGTRAQLVALADRNAEAAAASRTDRDDDIRVALERLRDRLGLARLPQRMECFDIAHIQGDQTVASMVTFVDGMPDKSLYRTFKVKTVTNDDFASMYEVIRRRFSRARDGAERSWALPDLVVIDGGKGQLASACAALADLGIELDGEQRVDVIGLAKERELADHRAPDRVYRRGNKDAILLRPSSAELYVLARIRDEAHRVANRFHRARRSKRTIASALDAIPGVGPTRRRQLLNHFGSAAGVRAASLEDLTRAPGMNRRVAAAILAHFASNDPKPPT